MKENDTENILFWFKDLEERLHKIISSIPYNKSTKNIVLPALSGIIIESCSLIDTFFNEEYLLTHKKNNYSILDFAPYYESLHSLSQRKSILYIYPAVYLSPFRGWVDKTSNKYTKLKWWNGYNKLKHSRTNNIDYSTLGNAILSLCALFQVIVYSKSFFNSLIRNNMLSFGNQFVDILKKQYDTNDKNLSALAESKFFANALGLYKFPKDINLVRPSLYGHDNNLSRFLVRD